MRLHDRVDWTFTAEATPQAAEWLAVEMGNALGALVPEASLAEAFPTAGGLPVIAATGGKMLWIVEPGGFESNEPPLIVTRTYWLDPARFSVVVEHTGRERMGSRYRDLRWRFSRDDREILDVITRAERVRHDYAPPAESLPRAVAAALGWQVPGDEDGPLVAVVPR